MKTNDVILQTVALVVFFMIIFFAVHLFFAGHYYPGGGFVGGLLASGALVLLLLAFDLKTVKQGFPADFKWLIALGLLVSAGTAAGSLLFNVPFFTHAYNYFSLPLFGKTSLHTAMLFDLGVFFVVIGVTMTIIQTIGESE